MRTPKTGLPTIAVLLLGTALFACDAERGRADLVLVNARVYTLDWGQPDGDGVPAHDAPYDADGWHPDAEAVAIRSGRIAFVGTADDVQRFRGAETHTIDMLGATVVPGFVDSHAHVRELGDNLGQVNLTGVQTEDEALARIRRHVTTVRDGEWILGYGWDEGAWANRYPTWDRLSELFPAHPVVLRSLHGFARWANRKAFEMAGITDTTRPPVGGEIVRNTQGKLTGVLLNRAVTMIDSAIPRDSPRQHMTEYHVGLTAMAEAGYVSVHEAGVSSRDLNGLEALERDEQLPIRVHAMLSARDETLMRRWIDTGPRTDSEAMLQVRSVKAYYDGALGSRGARLIADYADAPGHRGVSGDQYGFDENLVTDAMRAGFQVAIHAIGDAGNRETLAFFERVFAHSPDTRHNRHRIEHAQVVHLDDFAGFRSLGIIASMQPAHAVEDKAWAVERLGTDRIRGAYAWRTMRRNGVQLIFNSDLPGSDHSIGYGLHAAVTRRGKDGEPFGGWYSEQSLTVEEAVRGYTQWAAYAAFTEDLSGTIAIGKWADLTAFNIDPFVLAMTNPAAILDGQVVMTVVAGQVVYRR